MMNARTSFWFAALLAISLLVTGSSARAREEDEKPDPIDAEVQRLEEKDPSTGGMVQAAARGSDLWDRELNRVYQKLLQTLGSTEREALRASQRQWITFRDDNRKAIRAVFVTLDGSMYRPMAAHAELAVVKARAIQLRDLLRLLDEHEQ